MSKAVLVMDMPESCDKCPIKNIIDYGKWCVGYDNTFIDTYPEKPSWCPLQPIPERKGKHSELNVYDTDNHYKIGWNACIDEILR